MERIKIFIKKEEIKMTLKDVILAEIEQLRSDLNELEAGSKEYNAKADRLDKLMDKIIRMDEFDSKQECEVQQFNIEHELKRAQANEERKDRTIKNILQGLAIALPLGVTIWGTHKSIKFEQEGTITTIMGRGFIQKLLPKK